MADIGTAAEGLQEALAAPAGIQGLGLILEALPGLWDGLATRLDGLSIWAGGNGSEQVSEQLAHMGRCLHDAAGLAGETFMLDYARFATS